MKSLRPFDEAFKSLKKQSLDVVVFSEGQSFIFGDKSTKFDFTVEVEPTNESFQRAIKFASTEKYDGFVSVGGGSVMVKMNDRSKINSAKDTTKAANLYSTHPPNDFLDYVNKSIGKALPPPGPLKPHISVPTTSGTGRFHISQ